MKIKIENKNYDVKTNLRVAYKIQEEFDKPYLKVLSEITTNEAKIEDQIKVLYLGHSLSENPLNEDEFNNKIYDNFGVNQIMENLEIMINAIQYPGLNQEQIEDEIKKKVMKIKRMSSIGNY